MNPPFVTTRRTVSVEISLRPPRVICNYTGSPSNLQNVDVGSHNCAIDRSAVKTTLPGCYHHPQKRLLRNGCSAGLACNQAATTPLTSILGFLRLHPDRNNISYSTSRSSRSTHLSDLICTVHRLIALPPHFKADHVSGLAQNA